MHLLSHHKISKVSRCNNSAIFLQEKIMNNSKLSGLNCLGYLRYSIVNCGLKLESLPKK